MVVVEVAAVDVVEVAVAEVAAVADVTGPVRIAVIVTDHVKTAVRTVAMDLVPAVAPDPGAEVAVEARKNSAWTRRLSLLWVRLPLKVSSFIFQSHGPSHNCNLFQVKEIKKFQTTFSSRAIRILITYFVDITQKNINKSIRSGLGDFMFFFFNKKYYH